MTPEEKIFQGIAVSPGIAIGRVALCAHLGPVRAEQREIPPEEVENEVARFLKAVEESRAQIEKIRSQVAAALHPSHAEIYTAQLMFLSDQELVDATVADIRTEQKNADYLFARRVERFLESLAAFEDPFFHGRDSDFRDAAHRVLANLKEQPPTTRVHFGPETVLVAHDLAPSQAANLLRENVIALALERGGATSHTAIMAKAIEIPAVVGLHGITSAVQDGAPIIVDGLAGKVILYPSQETFLHYSRRQGEFIELEQQLEKLRELPCETVDGYSVVLRANLEFPNEVPHVILHGAKGVGLFRTEFVFLNRESPPTEEEQYALYRQVAEGVYPETVVFRTLDLGGDKLASVVQHQRELNPFMGQRAIRICLQNPNLFRTQLRAICRASSLGNAQILIPMVSGIEEMRAVRRHLEEVKAELAAENIPFDPQIPLGAMIEIPSAAVTADILARECDFFSIGTNDLIQYTLAVDRGNELVAYLYQPLHPAILRLLKMTVSAAEDAGIRVSVCGETAADPMMALLFVGMGVQELSMSSVNVPAVKQVIRAVSLSEAKLLAEEILSESSTAQTTAVMKKWLDKLTREERIPAGELFTASYTHIL